MSKENGKLYKELTVNAENGYKKISPTEKKTMDKLCEDYRKFITAAKTEREFCLASMKALEKAGFSLLDGKTSLKAGDRVYSVNRGKGIMAAVIGREPVSSGVNIVGAHIDSPRLDLKPNPLYEDSEIAFFKTHYYGGIKKYQWTTIPLSIHGVIVKADNTQIEVCIGENDDDPIFCITDLLPHLATKQMTKKMAEAVPGETLNLLIGNIPIDDDDVKEQVKFGILKYLNEKYEITEEDFISAELEVVPAFPARDAGLDRSMIAGYGQDDRVCAYTALRAVTDVRKPEKTAICLLVDKEEIGSMGNTGMKSRFFENTLAQIAALTENDYSDLTIRRALSNSMCLSADVGAAFDPNYPDVYEKRNSAILNNGLMLSKYTGSRGKSGSSDASAELMAKIRGIFNENGVIWQMGELGKVDLGGGGTIAQYVANLDVDVVDCGVPLFSMHSPYEVAGKIDIYMAYKGYHAFLK